MKPRTDEDWNRIFESTMCAIINGSMANVSLCQSGVYSIINEGIDGADYLVEKLKRREEKEMSKQ